MMLEDVRDYIASLGKSDHTYMGKLDHKKECSIGVYHSKHSNGFKTALGGPSQESYGIKSVTFLIHWNKSPRETEKASKELYEALRDTREANTNNKTIKFIQLLYNEPIDVGTDDNGIYEMVIDAAIVYEK
ncbi:MAG: hypothetical protein IJZ53_07600 [Tyzzerella sp.]|nr:hypothetical protein [Tyzzerella sp.]